jgi:ABC-type lipoprotein release transport system permease subunit
LLGVVLGALANLYFYFVGLDFGALMKGMEDMDIGYRISGVIKSGWDIPAFYNAIIISFIASVLASLLPARKTVKMQAMECLRINQ